MPEYTNDQMWEVIESVDWEKNADEAPDTLKRRLMRSFSREMLDAVRAFKGQLFSALYKRVETYE